MMGIAFGGLYGFAAALLAVVRNPVVSPSLAFATSEFWWQFWLALLTGFWESLFFFSFVMLVILRTLKNWSLFGQLWVVVGIFLIFHLPNAILRFQGVEIWYQLVLLTLFAFGQSLLFFKERNGYSLAISHAIWGMVLLFHF